MNFYKKYILTLSGLLFLLSTFANADNHDTTKSNVSKEEPLPLNDPFVGDSSFTGGVKILSESGNAEELQRLSLYNFKLVGVIAGTFESYISLINEDGEVITVGLNEELSDGVKLVELRRNEAIFEKDSESFIIINFKNEIKETNEY
ncbi:pilus assembly protein PilP [Candidatus Pelagibacter sp.]|nr:pilus assembly protein PilP [Candidatus Pelagibacter sp.]